MLRRLLVFTTVMLIYSSWVSYAAPLHHQNDAETNLRVSQRIDETASSSREAAATEVIANYTIKLAWLTGVLAIVGIATGGLGFWQILLSRAEFLASNRPELVIREVVRDTGSEKFAMMLINRGRSPCRVVESLLLLRANVDPALALDPRGVNDIGPLQFEPGEYRRVEFSPQSEGEAAADIAFDLGFLETYGLRGVIIYEDRAGVRRRMVFARHLAKGEDVFRRLTKANGQIDLDAEYTD